MPHRATLRARFLKARSARRHTISSQTKKNTKAIKLLVLSQELKFQDNEFASAAIVSVVGMAGAEMDSGANYMPSPAQGDGNSERIGREIIVTGIEFQGGVFLSAGTDNSAQTTVRVMLIRDNRTDGSQFNSEDVLATVAQAENIASGQRDLSKRKKFTVLMNKRITLNPPLAGLNASVVTPQISRHWSYSKHGMKVKMRWSDDGNNVASCETNSFHVLAVGDQTGANLHYRCRILYKG